MSLKILFRNNENASCALNMGKKALFAAVGLFVLATLLYWGGSAISFAATALNGWYEGSWLASTFAGIGHFFVALWHWVVVTPCSWGWEQSQAVVQALGLRDFPSGHTWAFPPFLVFLLGYLAFFWASMYVLGGIFLHLVKATFTPPLTHYLKRLATWPFLTVFGFGVPVAAVMLAALPMVFALLTAFPTLLVGEEGEIARIYLFFLAMGWMVGFASQTLKAFYYLDTTAETYRRHSAVGRWSRVYALPFNAWVAVGAFWLGVAHLGLHWLLALGLVGLAVACSLTITAYFTGCK